MAYRPVYKAFQKDEYREYENISFTYYSGFALSQKHRSIKSLHDSFLSKHTGIDILEISTKSPNPLGVQLSAFNLPIELKNGSVVPFECAFQSSKVFSSSGAQKEVLKMKPWEAKKYISNFANEKVVGFEFEGDRYDNIPTTFFYNWLYVNALTKQCKLCEELASYGAFTDIEFNPNKSINCQAEAASVYVSLLISGKLDEALSSTDCFKKIVYAKENRNSQLTLPF